jgi:ribonuclease HII
MPTTDFEARLWAQGFTRIMGLDEVGRGCLAGPVVAAGVIFHPDRIPAGIDDSKKLSAERRADLAVAIREYAVYSAVAESDVAEIGRLNILWASLKAMSRCAEAPGADPDYLLVDGNRYSASLIPHTCIVKGDARSVSIAAASILAKEYRDDLMRRLHEAHPEYGWDRNVGYPTPEHRRALARHGPSTWHREGFRWSPG